MILLACVAFGIWLYLIVARGGFWLATIRDEAGPAPRDWPAVAAVIPARNEADGIGECVASLGRQDYPGRFSIIVVDDQSTDGTGAIAQGAARASGFMDRLTVLAGSAPAAGWTGKLWAMKQGIEHARPRSPTYLLLTDGDIVYSTDMLSRLVAKAETDGLVLNSLMAKLRCVSLAERALVPAFVFFFQMLYPFAWVNRPKHRTAAAAGGCMLVRLDALRAAGGVESIRGELIDDCALAAKLKQQGPIRLALTDGVHSIRAYPAVGDFRRMVARSAYAQLRYSPVALVMTLAGMALTYWTPVMLTIFGRGFAQASGIFVWAIIALAFQPTLRFYQLSPLWGLFVPAIALMYMAFTLDSAYQQARGAGGLWKGRVQAPVR